MHISQKNIDPAIVKTPFPFDQKIKESMKILVVEDDKDLNEQLFELLSHQGYQVETCFDGESGLSQASQGEHHLVLLDVMLPKLDGFSLLNSLRKYSQIPVMMLTAKGAEEERIKGFSEGVDDYLIKPFNTTELLLRIDALLRRSHASNESHASHESELDVNRIRNSSIQIDGLFLNKMDQSVKVGDKLIVFTPIQFRLLWTLLLHQGEVLSKAFLYQQVLNKTFGPHDRSLDMHLSRVRRKLISAGWEGERLQTVHGEGYCLS